jgi:hypothetical protein
MKVKKKFLQLTKYTYPYGTEGFLKSFLPSEFQQDYFGNYFLLIGENPKSMFTCHLDTACKIQEKVTHNIIDHQWIATDRKTILGADDKAGMVVILSMIEKKIPGLYYFFIGEEVGCVGSGDLSDHWVEFPEYTTIQRVVSFDRRGTTSVITHQLGGRCCSDEFAKELSSQLNSAFGELNLVPDNTGVVTDSAQFTDIIPECTNISVGYYKEHTFDECQDIQYLTKLCRAVCQIDWDILPTKRIAGEKEPVVVVEKEFSEEYFSYFKDGNYATKKMYISLPHVISEINIIWQWVQDKSTYFNISRVDWNGNRLILEDKFGNFFELGQRSDLMELIPQLSSVPKSELRSQLKFTPVL